MSGGIFISYRREDSAFWAEGIYDRLIRRLEREQVFIDVDSIPAGAEFVGYLRDRVGASDALLVVIGQNWLSSRLDDPDDHVRIEIETALARGIRVIPVLVDGATMPRPDALPDTLKALTSRQPFEISAADFNADTDRLAETLAFVARAAGEEVRRSREATDDRSLAEAEAARRAAEERFAREESEARNAAEPAAARAGSGSMGVIPLNELLSVTEMQGYVAERRNAPSPAAQGVGSNELEDFARPPERPEVVPRRIDVYPRYAAPAMTRWLWPLLVGVLVAGASFTGIGRSVWGHILSLLGLKLGAGPILPSVDGHSTEPIEDAVECSVFGPPAAPPGQTILIQVFLHLANQAERASFLASTMDASAKLKATKSLDLTIKRGARVKIALSAEGLEVDAPVQSVVWRGEPAFCQFLVTIPAGTDGQSFFLVIRVGDGKLVGAIKFRLSADATASQPSSEPLGDHAKRYQYAFVSYASNDRREVLKRVEMLEILKTEFFQDILSLDPGDRWEKKLYENIDRCDLFLLFWSQAAADSQWVIKEAEYALAHQQKNPNGEPDLVPVVLEQNVPPPPSLSAFHFNDRISYLVSLMP
jgi:hypothetical protein